MERIITNPSFIIGKHLLFAGDYEVVGPDPRLGHQEVADLGVDMIFIHYHHRHEFRGGHPRGLWGSTCCEDDSPNWEELDRTVESAKRFFRRVAIYPVGWAHMVPARLGETLLDVDPEILSDWVVKTVSRYWKDVDLFPIFYEMNVFDLFFRVTHGQSYEMEQKEHVVECLTRCVEKVKADIGDEALSKLTAGTFVELTQSSFYWMSEGKLLELPRGSALVEAPLSPFDLIKVADSMDAKRGVSRHTVALRQLLHTIVFWNADDSGSSNLLQDDLKRIASAGYFYDSLHSPNGFVHFLIAGWDAQPQNTYQYLLNRMVPEYDVPSPAECLGRHYASFCEFMTDGVVPQWVKSRVIGFVLDDVFKCRKQSGITSATVPNESLTGGMRTAHQPVTTTDIGKEYARLIGSYKNTHS